MVGIIDYGLGNLGSIQNMLKVIGEKSVISYDKNVLDECERFILPGVGAFDTGIKQLRERNLVEFIQKKTLEDKTPLLGICLGMQLLGRCSEEGKETGLDLIPFESIRFQLEHTNLRVPHMGWDVVDFKQDIPLLKGIDGEQRYYFVHSYHAVCDDDRYVMMSCDYGYEFAAAVVNENVMGVQFHPEKSHDFGMKLLSNFVKEC